MVPQSQNSAPLSRQSLASVCSQAEPGRKSAPGSLRATILCVLVVHALLLITLVAIPNRYVRTVPWLVAYVGIQTAQVSLLSIWVGLGAGRWPLRLLAAWAFAVFIAGVSLKGGARLSLARWIWLESQFGLPVMLAIIFPLAIARLRGWRLVRFSPGPPPLGRPWQFSVRHLLLAMVVVAILLGIAHYARGAAGMHKGLPVWPSRISTTNLLAARYGVWALRFVVGPLLAVWACLGIARAPARVLAAAFVASAHGALPPYCFNGTGWDYLCSIGIGLAQIPTVVITLLVFRAIDFRVIRTREPEPSR